LLITITKVYIYHQLILTSFYSEPQDIPKPNKNIQSPNKSSPDILDITLLSCLKRKKLSFIPRPGPDEIVNEVDVSCLEKYSFKDVAEIRKVVEKIFAPKNIKMICKRAERIYQNSYAVFVLYCHRWAKRGPNYPSKIRYKKQSTNCPFQIKFTKYKNCRYRMTDGVFYHNHDLDTAVMLPEIIEYLKTLDPMTCKPAEIRLNIERSYKKDLTYAQVAYEISKLRRKDTISQTSSLKMSVEKDYGGNKKDTNQRKLYKQANLLTERK
jgi:hypothetical protein